MSTKENGKTTDSKNSVVEIWKNFIGIYVVGLFAVIWILYYNLYAFRTGRVVGGILSISIYYFIYAYLSKLYKAWKIETYQIGEVVFSQILAIGIADMILYVECCLIARRYVNVIPGIVIVLLQIAGMTIWAVAAKRYIIKNIKASKTVVIYGKEDVDVFVDKLKNKYTHLFDIKECVYSEIPVEEIYRKIDSYETVMLYEIGNGVRTETMKYCIEKHKKFYMTPRVADIMIQGFENRTLIDTPLLKYEYSYLQPKTYHWKRILDVVVSLICMVLFAIPMAVAVVAIKLEDRGTALYKQMRYTKNEKVFYIWKFRSMVMDAEKEGMVIPCVTADPRITKVGRLLRRFRIDEMPQIFNVLKGDMSIVGPRPERIEHVQEYTKQLPEFAYRLRVNGGMTGYAQIYGKYNTSAEDKLKLDLMYIENQSLLLDLKLIMLTLKILFIPESTEGFAEEKSREIGDWKTDSSWKEKEKKIG